MFGTSKIVRVVFWACLAAAWLPLGNSLLQPSQARAEEIIRVGPIVRRPIVVDPVVPVAPAVRVAPIVRVGPVYPHPWYRRWYGFRWHR
jgi:hypothetical protein